MVSCPRRQLVRITYKFATRVRARCPAACATTGWKPSSPVGYRVRGQRGTQFRQWATARLQDYLVKGFVLDDERLKNPPGPGVPDYFDELLERIRDIRSSTRSLTRRRGVEGRISCSAVSAAPREPSPERADKEFRFINRKPEAGCLGPCQLLLVARTGGGASDPPNENPRLNDR
jgi:hypothetical protein